MRKIITVGLLCVMTSLYAQVNVVADSMTVTDCQGNVYPIVEIGGRYWMAENLRCSQYDFYSELALERLVSYNKGRRNPSYVDARYPTQEIIEKFGLRQEDTNRYGYLYNWYGAMGVRKGVKYERHEQRQGICPNGWHIPTMEEWDNLICWCGGIELAGYFLKASVGWSFHCEKCKSFDFGNNDYGFSALPTGWLRLNNNKQGEIEDTGYGLGIWLYENNANPYCGILYDADTRVFKNTTNKTSMYSVRCVKNYD